MAKDQYDVLGIYIAFMLSILSNFIPLVMVQMIGGILFFVTIVAIYFIRWKSTNASFKHNHMDYLIKTFWVASLILLIGIVFAVFFADHTVINNVVDGMENGIPFTQEELNIVLLNYAKDNVLTFALSIGPCFLYIFYRTVRGMIETMNYNKIENIKSWF